MFKENKKSNKCMKINTIKLKDIYFNEIVLSMGRYKNRYFCYYESTQLVMSYIGIIHIFFRYGKVVWTSVPIPSV